MAEQQGVQSIEVGMMLLRALAARGDAVHLKGLAADAGMAAAKAHRYLVSLIRAGMVEQDAATGRYRLGQEALWIGLSALGGLDVMRLGDEALEALRDEIGESVLLAVWGNKGPVVVRWAEAGRPVTTNVRPGSVMPLLNSSTGRTFAAFMPAEATEALIAEETRENPDFARGYEKVLEETRKTGLGRVDGDMLPGIAALSAPVFDHQGEVAAVMSALGYQGTFDASPRGATATSLRQAAGALSARLGYRASGQAA